MAAEEIERRVAVNEVVRFRSGELAPAPAARRMDVAPLGRGEA